jgi:hypothetical protein
MKLPLFSVLIKFTGPPPEPLVRLLRELGFISEGQSDQERKEIIRKERVRTWLHYSKEKLW